MRSPNFCWPGNIPAVRSMLANRADVSSFAEQPPRGGTLGRAAKFHHKPDSKINTRLLLLAGYCRANDVPTESPWSEAKNGESGEIAFLREMRLIPFRHATS